MPSHNLGFQTGVLVDQVQLESMIRQSSYEKVIKDILISGSETLSEPASRTATVTLGFSDKRAASVRPDV